VKAFQYLDGVFAELFDMEMDNTWITFTVDLGEVFGEDGHFGHGPIQHDKVYEVPIVEGKLR
jgi:arylsulfatase A-like enzyme